MKVNVRETIDWPHREGIVWPAKKVAVLTTLSFATIVIRVLP